MASRVLVVDDDAQIVRAVRTSLQARGYDVRSAGNGETALDELATEGFDVVILDLSLPGIDGHDVIRRLRAFSDIPVLILSVRDAQDDKIEALDAGADDYVTKPFSIGELLARLRAVERRAHPETPGPSVLRFGGLEVDLAKRLVRVDGSDVRLTPTELRLLEAFVTNPGKLLTHRWLLSKVWGPGYVSETHYVRIYVRALRRKLLDDPSRPRLIATEPGLGYRWKPEPDRG
jgi:two-component system KDP operon response regulator KdpE